MNNIVKCPICEEDAYINGPLFMCRECPFVINYIDLHRIAAAMELAKAELSALETAQQTDSDEEIYEAFNIRNEARKRVLEVFK